MNKVTYAYPVKKPRIHNDMTKYKLNKDRIVW